MSGIHFGQICCAPGIPYKAVHCIRRLAAFPHFFHALLFPNQEITILFGRYNLGISGPPGAETYTGAQGQYWTMNADIVWPSAPGSCSAHDTVQQQFTDAGGSPNFKGHCGLTQIAGAENATGFSTGFLAIFQTGYTGLGTCWEGPDTTSCTFNTFEEIDGAGYPAYYDHTIRNTSYQSVLSDPVDINGFIDTLTASFVGITWSGISPGAVLRRTFNDFIPLEWTGMGGLGFDTVDLSTITQASFDGSIVIVPDDSTYPYPQPVLDVFTFDTVPTSYAGFDINGIVQVIEAIQAQAPITTFFVLVTWVIMTDGTHTAPDAAWLSSHSQCCAYDATGASLGGTGCPTLTLTSGYLAIPVPDLKTLPALAGSRFVDFSSAPGALPMGIAVRLLQDYNATTWAAAGSPY